MSLSDLTALNGKTIGHIKYDLFVRGDELPDFFKLEPRGDDEDSDFKIKFGMGFFRDRQWLFSGVKDTQPLTYKALMAASDLYLLSSQRIGPFGDYSPGLAAWYIESSNRLIYLKLQREVPTLSSVNSPLTSLRLYENAKPSLGSKLALAYCSYISGMGVVGKLTEEYDFSCLSRGVLDWDQIYLPMLARTHKIKSPYSYGPKRATEKLKSELEYLASKFDFMDEEIRRFKFDGTGLTRGLRTFIDTRLYGEYDGPGDNIVVQTPSDKEKIMRDRNGEPLIFRIKDHNWTSFQVINNPASVIDQYVAHVLANTGTRFDFDPYCTEF